MVWPVAAFCGKPASAVGTVLGTLSSLLEPQALIVSATNPHTNLFTNSRTNSKLKGLAHPPVVLTILLPLLGCIKYGSQRWKNALLHEWLLKSIFLLAFLQLHGTVTGALFKYCIAAGTYGDTFA